MPSPVRLLGSAFFALATLAAAHAVETLPSADIVPDLPASAQVPPNDPAVQANLPGCAVWTDRCVTCQRDAGKVTCSNIGIACQPGAVVCVRPEPAEQKPAEQKPAEEKREK
jgi:hypothetical protein